MNDRATVARAHRVSSIVAFSAILLFWTSTVTVELLGSHDAIVFIKRAIAWGLILLVPAIATAGATGFRLGGRSKHRTITAKKRRMPVIALLGLLILVPSALFLAAKATTRDFDGAFVIVQGAELVAGAVNLMLMGLNMRDGFRLTKRFTRRQA